MFSSAVSRLLVGGRNVERMMLLSNRGAKRSSDMFTNEPAFLHEDDVVIESTRPEEMLDSAREGDITGLDKGEGSKERSLNSVTLIGRVGSDPQMRGSTGKPVVTFSVATNVSWKTDEGFWTHRTDWHNIAVFNKFLRDPAFKYVGKGRRVHIQGRLAYGEIVDKAGIRRHTTSIIADDIIYLDAGNKR